MRLLSILCSAAALLAAAADASSSHGLRPFKRAADRLPVLERHQPHRPFQHPRLQKRASPYLNNVTEKFVVNGSALPDVDFDVGESYAGLLPLSGAANETRELFFWFFPSSNPLAADEVTIWLNGGPGCSSLSGLLAENGPFIWQPGTLTPTQNPYTWVNLTNMLWVEQPVGVGFTQGTPDISDEIGLAQEFIGFYKQFVKAFALQGRKVYITGESYAGYYVPYIADAFINAHDKTYYNLAGVAINDPILGDEVLQEEVVIAPFMNYWNNILYLNDTFVQEINERAAYCNYTSYLEKYLTFPPPQEKFETLPDPFYDPDYTCDLWDDVYAAALEVNPCWNIYHITETCPTLWSVLGIVNEGDYSPPGEVIYFNRSDVQAAINAPIGTDWAQCTDTNVFGGPTDNQSLGDNSLGPAQDGVLQHVIEYTNNTIIGVGNLDFILPTNGTLLVLQNVTWNGKQGFQSFPGTPFYVPYHAEYNGGAESGAGYAGYWGTERGLTFYQVQLSGHEMPQYAPGAAYRVVEKLLGRVTSLDEVSDFTTQSGNYTGTGTIYKRMQECEGCSMD